MNWLKGFWYDYGYIFIILLVTISIFAVPILGISAASYVAELNYCNKMEVLATDYTFDMSFWTGCLVQTESGYWTSAHDYFNRFEVVPMDK